MNKHKGIALFFAGLVLVGVAGLGVAKATEEKGQTKPPAAAGPVRRAYWRTLGIKTAKLRLRTVDADTQQPIAGAGCVVGETGDRIETDAKGTGPMMDEPVFRHPRLEEMLAQLHGQLTVLCYKNGYRDSIYMGVRMDPGATTETDVWMHKIGVGSRRIEPTLYQEPIHRLWQIQLADKYRLRDEGQGPERPELTNPNAPPAPQQPMGGGIQTPVHPGPAGATTAPGTAGVSEPGTGPR